MEPLRSSSPGIDVRRTASLPLAYDRAIQYSRDGSALSREAAAYWVARSSRAMTAGDVATDIASPSRGTICPRYAKTFSLEEGAGNAGRTLHPRSRVQIAQRKTHTSIQVQRRHSGIPCAMVLRLISCSPRRRIRLVTVAAGLMAESNPVGSISPPTAWHQQRVSGPHGFAVRFGAVRLRAVVRSRKTALRTHTRRRQSVHRIPSHVRDDARPPLLPGKDGASW
jgi:hypothetical protein